MSSDTVIGHDTKTGINWKRIFFLLLGVTLFLVVNFSPPWGDAVDPQGNHFELSKQGKGALAVFLLAGTWWVFEVLPIGVTSIAIGVLTGLFQIRPVKEAFNDFMDPSVMFIFASIVIGMVFTKTGLTKRMAYKILSIVGENTAMIYLGVFVVIALLTHIMAHTAVAATVFPLLMTINALYDDSNKPSRFGKGLFMGMAYVAGAGSIITLLGAARGAVAIGFFKDMIGREISFFELSKYMFPVGWLMVFLLWGYFLIFYKPEKKVIHGLRDTVKDLSARMGPITSKEILAAVIVLTTVLALAFRSVVPFMASIGKTELILLSTLAFFIFGILDIRDLEEIPWNIILLFGGAMSIGFCLWQSGAAKWMAIKWLVLFQNAHWFVFVLGIAVFVLLMTNFIMNVAAIAISLPVALVIAPYLGVAPEVVFYSSLVTAGMPFVLLVGAAPNAIAYESKQFTSGEFFMKGLLASVMLIIVLSLAILVIWPLLGMPITINK
ncbi:sodium/sulfate symporter [Candidatus Magnetoovum chiemensis]|nr:sodium/sulfate symporter [Candidatus Magnetoovum chiemensis]